MESQIFELQYAMDTFYFLICGALVMWMAAGFSMLEAGLVRSWRKHDGVIRLCYQAAANKQDGGMTIRTKKA